MGNGVADRPLLVIMSAVDHCYNSLFSFWGINIRWIVNKNMSGSNHSMYFVMNIITRISPTGKCRCKIKYSPELNYVLRYKNKL